MSTDPVKAENSLEEQLVAYLDGELDAEAARRIEERLAAEPELREALNRLEQTWEMLDELGSTPVGESFTRTTLEMVTVAAEEDVQHALAEAPLRRRRHLWMACAGVLAATAAGFLAAHLALPNSNRQLLHDLPVLENLDEYRQVDDIDFLRLLKEQNLFPLPPPTGVPVQEPPRAANMTVGDMEKMLKNMPPAEKAELSQRKEIFDNLTSLEQAKLRELDREVQKDEDSAEIRRLMHDYYEWWKSLPPISRNELSLLSSPQERIKRIEQLKREELNRNPAQFLSDSDKAALRDWWERYLVEFEAHFREGLTEKERKLWDLEPASQHRMKILGFLFWQRGQGGRNRSLQLPDNLADLPAKLSPKARMRLAGKPLEEQWRTIQGWLFAIARSQHPPWMGRRFGTLVDENELAKFFESLPDAEQMHLLDLSPQDMQHQLQRMYMSRKKPMEPFFGRPEGPPPDGPRGPRNNPPRRPMNSLEKPPVKDR